MRVSMKYLYVESVAIVIFRLKSGGSMVTVSLGRSVFSLPCPSPLVPSPLRSEREKNEAPSASGRAESLGPRSPSRSNSLSTGTFTVIYNRRALESFKRATQCRTVSASSGQTYCLCF